MVSINEIDWNTLTLSFPEGRSPVRWAGDSFGAPSESVTVDRVVNSDSWIAFLGDTHGSTGALKVAVEACRAAGIVHAFHVGDFGYLFNGGGGRDNPSRYVTDDETDAILKQAREQFGFTLHVIDGNHDNHAIWHRGVEHNHQPYRVVDGAQWVYHPRGSRIELDLADDGGTVSIGFMGGARSVNVLQSEEKDAEGRWFWYDEEPTDEDVEHLIAGGKLDILVGHDAPTDHHLEKQMQISSTMQLLSSHTRNRLEHSVRGTNPDLYVHGHWHQFATGVLDETKLLCLNKEMTSGNLVFVDTVDNTVVAPQAYADLTIDEDSMMARYFDSVEDVKILR